MLALEVEHNLRLDLGKVLDALIVRFPEPRWFRRADNKEGADNSNSDKRAYSVGEGLYFHFFIFAQIPAVIPKDNSGSEDDRNGLENEPQGKLDPSQEAVNKNDDVADDNKGGYKEGKVNKPAPDAEITEIRRCGIGLVQKSCYEEICGENDDKRRHRPTDGSGYGFKEILPFGQRVGKKVIDILEKKRCEAYRACVKRDDGEEVEEKVARWGFYVWCLFHKLKILLLFRPLNYT